MKADFTVSGADDLLKRLNQLPDAVSRRVQINALRQGAEPIRSMAASLAPRDEQAGAPHLADNIIVQVPSASRADEEGLFDTVAVFIGPAIQFFYGFFYEVGTAFQPARAFLRPAFESESSRSLRIIGAEMWLSIRKHLGLGGGVSTAGRNL